MIVKLIAAVVVVLGGWYLGRYLSAEFGIHVRQLSGFQAALKQLEFNIRFMNLPLCDALRSTAETQRGVIGSILKEVADGLTRNRGSTVTDAWDRAVQAQKGRLCLADEELGILSSFAEHLGAGDCESEVNNIRAACLKLKVAEEAAREEMNKNDKLYRSMGVLLGILVVIVMF